MTELIQLCREAVQSETVVALFIALVTFLIGTGLHFEWRRFKTTMKLLESAIQFKKDQAGPKTQTRLFWLLACLICFTTGLLIGICW